MSKRPIQFVGELAGKAPVKMVRWGDKVYIAQSDAPLVVYDGKTIQEVRPNPALRPDA